MQKHPTRITAAWPTVISGTSKVRDSSEEQFQKRKNSFVSGDCDGAAQTRLLKVFSIGPPGSRGSCQCSECLTLRYLDQEPPVGCCHRWCLIRLRALWLDIPVQRGSGMWKCCRYHNGAFVVVWGAWAMASFGSFLVLLVCATGSASGSWLLGAQPGCVYLLPVIIISRSNSASAPKDMQDKAATTGVVSNVFVILLNPIAARRGNGFNQMLEGSIIKRHTRYHRNRAGHRRTSL